ncbi:hypothetical protein M378DRAFT_162335 [Amanita muscaria Koide BX008]|uniref:Uncharacterized protein n=1 Tax=Amanita muscaria (strain Koide BX008) TaxID=946122 RepID=A0A0C2TE47_AMAMK|nr:hypothetical protein M378DRAFT_162335 [Amanita muscaria Koide BX008]
MSIKCDGSTEVSNQDATQASNSVMGSSNAASINKSQSPLTTFRCAPNLCSI